MKPMPNLDALLERAVKLGIFGTKMRSVINLPSSEGVAAIVAQQFEIGDQIAGHGLMPIIEPEVSIKSPDKAGAESLLRAEILKRLDALPEGRRVMLKLTIPDEPDFYGPLVSHPRVARVVALSGGYTREDACKRLAANHGMIASFSRALAQDLRELDERSRIRRGSGQFYRRDLHGFDGKGLNRRGERRPGRRRCSGTGASMTAATRPPRRTSAAWPKRSSGWRAVLQAHPAGTAHRDKAGRSRRRQVCCGQAGSSRC